MRAIAYYGLTNGVGIEILEANEREGKIYYRLSLNPNEKRSAKIYYTNKGAYFITKYTGRVYLDDCLLI